MIHLGLGAENLVVVVCVGGGGVPWLWGLPFASSPPNIAAAAWQAEWGNMRRTLGSLVLAMSSRSATDSMHQLFVPPCDPPFSAPALPCYRVAGGVGGQAVDAGRGGQQAQRPGRGQVRL